MRISSRCATSALVVLLAALGVVGLRAAQPGHKSKTFVGPMSGADPGARIGLVADDQARVMIYVCGHDAKFNQDYSRWLTAKVGADGTFSAASPDGVKVDGAIKGEAAEGMLAAKDGKSLSWRAALVPADSHAGLYRQEYTGEGIDFVAGWIIDTTDEVAGAVKNKKTNQTTTNNQQVTGGKVSNGSGTAPAGKGDPGKAILGVSKKASDQLLKAAKDNDQAVESKAVQDLLAINKGLDSGLKPENAALAAAVGKNKDLAALAALLKKLAQQNKGKKLTAKDIEAQAAALAQAFNQRKKGVEDALKDANIDPAKVAGVARKLFGNNQALRDDLLGTLVARTTPIKSAQQQGALVLKAPFIKTETDENSADVVSTNVALASLSGNLTLIGQTSVLGAGTNRALVGNFVTLPSGFSKLRVTVKLHESHTLSAGAVLGGAHAAADILIEVTGGSNSQTQSSATNISTVIAPVIFTNTDKGTADHLVSKTFTIPSTGGEFFIRAGMRSDFEAGSIASAFVNVSAQVQEIDVAVQN
jgi:hypothetical protein